MNKIITEKDKANENLKEKYGKKIDFLPYGTRAKLFTYIFKYFYLCLKTIFFYFKFVFFLLVEYSSQLGFGSFNVAILLHPSQPHAHISASGKLS